VVLVAEPREPSVVLGSTTAREAFDLERLCAGGLRVVSRGSGGGAVVVAPGAQLWLHVFLPAHDARFDRHLGRSFVWLGERVAAALTGLGLQGVELVRERVEPAPLARLVCFAGWGWGEVAIGGRKVAGLAQRRRRDGAMFQLAVLVENHQDVLIDALRAPVPGSLLAEGLARWGVERAALREAVLAAILDS